MPSIICQASSSICGVVVDHQADIRADGAQLADKVLIAAVDMIDLRYLGDPADGKRGDYHGGAGAKVDRPDFGSRQRGAAVENRGMSDDADGCAHLLQLVCILEPVFDYRFVEVARPFRKAHKRAHLRLHVGREAGIGQGLHIDPLKRTRSRYIYRIVVFLDKHAHLLKLCRDRLKVLGDDVC
jgi:hypothetical protein